MKTPSNTNRLPKKEVKFLKSIGFKKERVDQSCFWMTKKLHNRFIRKGEITVEPGSIIVWGREPKCIRGHSDNVIVVSGTVYSRTNIAMLVNYFANK